MSPFRSICIALLLGVIACAGYWQSPSLGFTTYDDPDYVLENPAVRAGLSAEGVRWAFTAFHSSNWHPLTWMSHMLDWELYGDWAGGHHMTNVLLHAANAAILFLLLQSMTGAAWRSAFVAALFAVHPLHVESVAWIAERKDVLSTFFGFLALLAYSRYARRPSMARYAAVAGSFALSLMSKPMLVTLPALMLVLDHWPLRRLATNATRDAFQLRWLVLEKLPLFALSACSCVITILAQRQGGSIKALDVVPFAARLKNTILAYAQYIYKMIWPVDLAVLYPYPEGVRSWQIAAAAAGLAVISWIAVQGALSRKRPHLLAGWLWYLGTLVPVIGLVQVGIQSHADRYTYVPLVGLFIMLAWSIPSPRENQSFPSRWRWVSGAAAALLLASLLLCTMSQVKHWRDGATLFERAIAVTGKNPVACNNLGTALVEQGRLEEAEASFRDALALDPAYAKAHNNLGNVLTRMGRAAESIQHFEMAMSSDPWSTKARLNYGLALMKLSKTAEALEQFQHAVRINPRFAPARFHLAEALVDQEKLDDAIEQLHIALEVDPNFPGAARNLANALMKRGRLDDAIAWFRQALQADPGDATLHYNLGTALARRGQMNEAVTHLQRAVALEPAHIEARHNLGNALAALGRHEEAIEAYRQTLERSPGFAAAHFNLGNALLATSDLEAAMREFAEAIRLKPDYLEARLNLAYVLEQLDRMTDAADQYREILSIDPQHGHARQRLNALQRGSAARPQPSTESRE